MSSLSSELLGVIEALPPAFKEPVGSKYRELVSNNTSKLDEIKARADDAPPAQRVVEAATALEVLFGANAVTPESAMYDAVRKANW